MLNSRKKLPGAKFCTCSLESQLLCCQNIYGHPSQKKTANIKKLHENCVINLSTFLFALPGLFLLWIMKEVVVKIEAVNSEVS